MHLHNPTIEQLKQLDEFVSTQPSGNYFQSSSIYHLYSIIPNYSPILLTSQDENNNLTGILLAVVQRETGKIKGRLSSRCVVAGGPLVKDNDLLIAEKLINKLIHEVKNKSIYIEFRNLFIGDYFNQIFIDNNFKEIEYYNFVVPIVNLEENKKKLSASKRRQINKGFKNGARIIEPEKIDHIREFYKILAEMYTTKVKKPLPPYDFFEKFYKDKATGKYFLVEYKGKIIGGIMCPIFNDTIYEWYECGLDKEYKDVYPSVLATWAAIEYAANNELKYFDFMGAGSADEDYGVREFKSKFGGEQITYKRYIKINNKFLYSIGKAGLKVLSLIK